MYLDTPLPEGSLEPHVQACGLTTAYPWVIITRKPRLSQGKKGSSSEAKGVRPAGVETPQGKGAEGTGVADRRGGSGTGVASGAIGGL